MPTKLCQNVMPLAGASAAYRAADAGRPKTHLAVAQVSNALCAAAQLRQAHTCYRRGHSQVSLWLGHPSLQSTETW